jgi:EAL domain-containing protein (putative c-di-GMP-specific phosphodiesterase class I)
MAMSAAESITHLDLDSAIKSKQLTAHFEPYVALRRLQARGVELHMIWQHPQYGRLAPSLFMPFIMAEGRSRQITSFMLREAARAAADWRRAGLDWSVSVNLPLEDLADGTLPSLLGMLFDEFELPPETLIIDIGEADLVARGAQALPAVTGLRALGCGVALDSAPGDAMIQDLRGLPFTEIKVSGAAIVQFVDRTHHSGTGRVAARVYNARSNNIPVMAVGVDSEAMLWSVQRLEFDAAQGPYICAPTDAISLVRWEKIWCEAAENIRSRKVSARRPLASAEARQRPVPRPLPAPQPAAEPELPPIEEIYPEPVGIETSSLETAQPDFVGVGFSALDLAQADFESDRIDVAAFQSPAEHEAEIGSNPPPFAEETPEEITEETPLAVQADRPSLPVEPLPQPAKAKLSGPAEDAPVLIPRKLPGIAKPIVMTVQNQGPERFKFLKKLARKA